MTLALALCSLALGAVYTCYGVLTLIDLARNARRLGMSHFALAWIAMAFTCGPHHLENGLHLLNGTRTAGALELVAVVVGIPAGVVWFLLRVEATAGGRGDRSINGMPRWVTVMPRLAAVYALAFAAAAVSVASPVAEVPPTAASNIVLVGLYGTIGWFLLRTQLATHAVSGEWSLSGLSLTVVFPTCALMHAAWVVYQLSGAYTIDIHAATIDWLAVPAATYFLWVVRGLCLGTVHDWNEATTVAKTMEALT